MSVNEPPEIALNDFVRQWAEIRTDALAAFERVGESGWYVLGQGVLRLEEALARRWGLPFAVGTGNGLDAIEIALRAAGLAPGDRVLTTPLSAFATSLAIVRAGGVPVFVDVDDRGLLDLDAVRAVLASDPEIRFLVPVHLFGRPIDLDALEELRRSFGLTVVEDCAQSIGARWNGRPTGTVGIAAATSFYPTKNLGTLGDGGGVLTHDAGLAERARSLRHYGQVETYRHVRMGLNSRLDEVQAAVLADALLPRLDAWTERRRETASRYLAEIRNVHLRLPVEPEGSDPCWHLFPILVRGTERRSLVEHLRRAGIASGCHYPTLIPDQPAWNGTARCLVARPLPRAAAFVRDEISLPIHPFLRPDEVSAVVHACNCWEPS